MSKLATTLDVWLTSVKEMDRYLDVPSLLLEKEEEEEEYDLFKNLRVLNNLNKYEARSEEQIKPALRALWSFGRDFSLILYLEEILYSIDIYFGFVDIQKFTS